MVAIRIGYEIVQRVPNKPNNEYTSTAQTEQIAELEAARDEATAKIESLESRLAALPPPTRNRLLVSLYRCIVELDNSIRTKYSYK